MKPTTSKLLITKGRLIDAGGERSADVRIANGVVVEVGVGLLSGDGEQVVDAAGMVVCPGFVDLHVHVNGLASSCSA